MIGTGELLIILSLILLLFGGKRLPELARSLGLGIREFKRACNGEGPEDIPSNIKEIAPTTAKEREDDHLS